MNFLDDETIEVECPQCRFYNPVFFRQVRLNDVVICRGCKANVQLTDYLGQVSNAQRAIIRAIGSLSNIKIQIRL